MSYKAVSHGGTFGFPSDDAILARIQLAKYAYWRKSKDDRMNLKLARHRAQVLKKRITIFAYLLALPMAISVLSFACKLAIYTIMN